MTTPTRDRLVRTSYPNHSFAHTYAQPILEKTFRCAASHTSPVCPGRQPLPTISSKTHR